MPVVCSGLDVCRWVDDVLRDGAARADHRVRRMLDEVLAEQDFVLFVGPPTGDDPDSRDRSAHERRPRGRRPTRSHRAGAPRRLGTSTAWYLAGHDQHQHAHRP
jgi:hypothetical protein